jgi:hypothetical protein
MAEREPLKLTTTDAVLGVVFIALVLGLIWLVISGTLANPVLVGVSVLYAVGVIMFGVYMRNLGRMSTPGLFLYVFIVCGITLLMYGFLMKGGLLAIRTGASFFEDALTNSLIYTLAILAVAVIAFALYMFYYKPKR